MPVPPIEGTIDLQHTPLIEQRRFGWTGGSGKRRHFAITFN
jgi:hypothetical protein